MSLGIQPGQKVRVAVVGAGDFGRNHARVYRELADAELVGIVDPSADPKPFTKLYSGLVASNGEMLIRNNELGHALAQSLGTGPAALLRGHGAVVVADSLHVVVGRAYYMNVNARELLQALMVPGSKITYIQPNEAATMAAQDGYERAWLLWKSAVQEVHKPTAGHNNGHATDK